MKVIFLSGLALILAGFSIGFFGGRSVRPESDRGVGPATTHEVRSRAEASAPSTLMSDDTAAILAEVPAAKLYDRLALWLLDASASEISDFFVTYSKRIDRTPELDGLVFVAWTRVDPEGAIAAAEGTEFSKYPWWAWTCYEPEKALKEVMVRYGESGDQTHIREVMAGLGEFHPAWLREHIDEFPEQWMKATAFSTYLKWADTGNPRESVEFLTARNHVPDLNTPASWLKENQLAALGAFYLESDPAKAVVFTKLLLVSNLVTARATAVDFGTGRSGAQAIDRDSLLYRLIGPLLKNNAAGLARCAGGRRRRSQ